MRRHSIGLAVLFLLLLPAISLADDLVASSLQYNVPLGDAGSALLAVSVLERQGSPAGETILIVPGFAQTAATFDALAHALFRPELGNRIARVLVLDLPAHGASGPPSAKLFGELVTAHYVAALLGTLDALHEDGIHPSLLLGHSLGGEIVQLAQERLLAGGSSLRAAHGVRGVMLLAPAIPSAANQEPTEPPRLPWLFADSGAAAPILGPWITGDPALGLIVYFPPPVWVPVFYGDRSGAVPAGAPSAADAAARGWIAPESLFIGLEITGLPPFPGRPPVREGLFARAHGTVAGVVAVSQDTLFLESEERTLYEFLTGDDGLKFFSIVDRADAVHNLHTFDAAPFAHPIRKVVNAAQAMN